MDDLTDLTNRFQFHPAKDEATAAAHQIIRHECFELSKILKQYVPAGREYALALTKLEEVMMWANAGIARSDKDAPQR